MTRMSRLALVPLAALMLLARSGGADLARSAEPPRPLVETICPLMEKEARQNGIPPVFFVRLIWRESAFRPNVVSHKGAQGIAQFMPATARERGLEDAFDPVSAISHAARLLADHMRAFGNFGLAAAAYNAGPERVRGWLEGRRTLPAETRDYVRLITGHTAEVWKEARALPLESSEPTSAALQESCRRRAPALVHAALPAKRSAPPSTPKTWGVQLASGFSQAKVAGVFSAIQTRHAKLLADTEPLFVPERNLSRGNRTIITVLVGAKSREEALKLCERLRAHGTVCTIEKIS